MPLAIIGMSLKNNSYYNSESHPILLNALLILSLVQYGQFGPQNVIKLLRTFSFHALRQTPSHCAGLA